MTGTDVDYPRLTRLLGSMYLESPDSGAIRRWREVFEGITEPAAVVELKDAVTAIDPDNAGKIRDLETEYARLFIGPASPPCPSWESVYTSPNRQTMQEAYDAMESLYAEAGVMVNAAGVMPDHIGAELNFLALLLDRIRHGEPRERQAAIGLADRLLDEHLNKWIASFSHDLERAATTPVYKALAQATRGIVALIQE